MTGFTAGAAILIATNQLKHFTGLPVPRGAAFSETWGMLFTHTRDVVPGILLTGIFTMMLGIIVKRWLPKLPYMIVAIWVAPCSALP